MAEAQPFQLEIDGDSVKLMPYHLIFDFDGKFEGIEIEKFLDSRPTNTFENQEVGGNRFFRFHYGMARNWLNYADQWLKHEIESIKVIGTNKDGFVPANMQESTFRGLNIMWGTIIWVVALQTDGTKTFYKFTPDHYPESET